MIWDHLVRFLGSANTRDQVLGYLAEHIYLALLPVLLGTVFAVLAAWLARSWRPARITAVAGANVLYTLPSLALFVLVPSLIGTSIVASINIVIVLTIYITASLVRPVLGALDAVEPHVLAAADAVGYRPAGRFFAVELPLAVPVLGSGVRVAAVTSISLVSVGALIGSGGLGVLFTDGFRRDYFAPIIVGIVLTVLLALVVDLLVVWLRRMLTPWERAGTRVEVDAA